jgi:exopolysaccharide biosynthesis polyprenyl glycosylphosphotransferase
VLGFIDDDPAKLGSAVGGVTVAGTRHDLARLVREWGIQEVILAITHTQQIHGDLFQALMDCRELGVEVVPMTYLYERLTGRVPVEHVGQQLYVLLPLNHSVTTPLYVFAKRMVDVACALAGLVGLALVFPLVALAIRLDSPGPVLYRQVRVGKGGRRFRVAKFRTMVQGAETPGEPVWAREHDERVTRFGRLARRVRLDELPQLWNVLKGEMSLVGPRPERPEFVQDLQEQIPFYRSRHAVRPGLTGWAQVNYEYGNSVADSLIKLQYDLYYVKHRSFYLDLVILFRTIGTVLSFSGT